ncbi:MAG: cytochrome-c peroxidase [Chlorobiales bacterium]|nr:cytochrome-c peroxidase [Chlorobiales bacterium]
MKTKSWFFTMAFFAMLTLGAWSSKGKVPSAAEGEKLFNDPRLAGSVNASSCATCHPDGKGLERAFENPELISVINACIAGPLEGQPLPEDSAEMQSLKEHVESLGGE